MAIETSKQFNSAVKSFSATGVRLENKGGELVAYAFHQAMEHGNSTPFMTLRAAIPTFVCKPKGMTQKNLDVFVQEFTSFNFVPKTKTYKQEKGKNVAALPVENAFKFWLHEREPEQEVTDVEQLRKLLTRAQKLAEKAGIDNTTMDLMLESVRTELDPNATVAATLGIAA